MVRYGAVAGETAYGPERMSRLAEGEGKVGLALQTYLTGLPSGAVGLVLQALGAAADQLSGAAENLNHTARQRPVQQKN